MKKFIVTLFVFCVTMVSAQSLEFSALYGYQFGSKLNYGPNYIKIDDSDEYGISLGFEMSNDVMAELTYIHQGTELKIRDTFTGPQEERFADLNGDWILLGASKYFKDGNVRPFAGGSMGLLFLAPSNENTAIVNRRLDNRTKFAFAFKAGVLIMFSQSIGIKLQGNMMFPVEWGGVYIGAGPGGVSGGTAASSTTIIGGLSGGLVFRFGT
ncbi:MAG: hypothetical protein OEQ81_12340 [Flavobacteriaceae bacterium]|nr:hypothetical protein [Flavobacteriaceae bacterium]